MACAKSDTIFWENNFWAVTIQILTWDGCIKYILLLSSSWLTKLTSGSILSWLMWLKSITELLSPLNDPNTSVQMFEWRRLYQPTKCYGFLVVFWKSNENEESMQCIDDLLIIALQLILFAFTAIFFSFVSRILSLPVRAYSHYLQRLILLPPPCVSISMLDKTTHKS